MPRLPVKTSTLERLGDARWRDLLLQHNRLMREQLNLYRGREVETTDDGFLAVFDGATRAVRCGMAMAAAVRELGIAIRVGIHTGELEFAGQDVRGVAVHAASRIMSVADPVRCWCPRRPPTCSRGPGWSSSRRARTN